MAELRERVARGEYAVDPSRIAGSLVVKMRLIRMARERLGTPPPRHRRTASG